jgi:F420-dependent oxidoreductase-like protein
MVEGQYALNWERWQRFLRAAEDLGFKFVFRSDHFTDASGPLQDSLECWVSLTYAATATQRIEFGPMVSPVTFRHPAMLARMAAAVDDLSGGRLVFGMGAGWQEREHHMFGVPFYDVPTRHAMLEEALEITERLLRNDTPSSFTGKYFSLDEALMLPRPQRRTPILIGGNGPTKTLPLAARFADEWNGVFLSPETYRERSALLDRLCADRGRAPTSIKRSLMTQVGYMRDDSELKRLLDEEQSSLDVLRRDNRIIVGAPQQVVEQLRAYEAAGVQRIMLQWLVVSDIARLEHMAEHVLPHFHQ